jgi:DNA repair protein RecO (recombination protein O)
MLVTTEALVLSKTNYSESSLIVRCYTRSDGIKSYMIKGGKQGRKGNKTIALFQPLNQLEITAQHKNKSGLSIPKSIKLSKPYQTIPFQMDKISVVLFLSEVLTSALREEEANELLFNYLTTSLYWFDMQDDIANFHIFFLISLTKHLGFFPDLRDPNHPYFDMENGCFSAQKSAQHIDDPRMISVFKSFLGTNFDKIFEVLVSSTERKQLLELLMRYYQIHLQGFSRPKSLNILHEIYS